MNVNKRCLQSLETITVDTNRGEMINYRYSLSNRLFNEYEMENGNDEDVICEKSNRNSSCNRTGDITARRYRSGNS